MRVSDKTSYEQGIEIVLKSKNFRKVLFLIGFVGIAFPAQAVLAQGSSKKGNVKQLNIQAGDRLLVDIQDGMIILLPQPKDYAAHLAGLHQEIWQNVDTTAYLEQERAAWSESKSD